MDNNSAPALRRGILVLRLLGRNSTRTLSLEQISRETGFPKSSLTRIMQALIDLGLVIRDTADRKYRAISRIINLRSRDEELRDSVCEVIPRLAETSGQTVEWYHAMQSGMIMVQKADPPHNEVRVRASIGFTRAWRQELDCVSCLGEAFFREAKQSKDRSGYWTYDRKGQRFKVTGSGLKTRIEQARKLGFMADQIPNPNGVRRMAVVVMRDGKPRGILCLAEVVTPASQRKHKALQRLLREQAQELCKSSSIVFSQ